MNHGERLHAKFAFSAAHRWLACAGFVSFAGKLPPAPPGVAAQKGTQAHEALERLLRAGHVNAYSCTELEPSYQECVQLALDYVYDLRRDDPTWELLIETRFDLSQEVGAECGGTADIVLWHPHLRELRVVDLKTGVTPVDPDHNAQLLGYATGVCFTLKLAPLRVALVIVAPRALDAEPDVRCWETDSSMLADFLADVQDAVRAAQAPDAPLTPGDHCEWCPCAHVCPAREQYALAVVQNSFADVRVVRDAAFPAPNRIDPARIALILSQANRLRQWLTAVETYAEDELRAGRQASVPGFKLVEARARRRWMGEPEEIARKLTALCGAKLEQFIELKLIGITVAQSLLISEIRKAGEAAGTPKKLITQYVTEAKAQMAFLTEKATSGNLTLVADADPRPAYSLTGDAFAGVTLEHGDDNADEG